MPNIYTILEKIKFDERVSKEIEIIKRTKDTQNFDAVMSDMIFSNFCFGLIRDFYDEILKDTKND